MPPDQTSQADAVSARGEWVWTAFAAALVAVFSLAFLFQDRQFFWNDDYQTYQLAGYRELARAWTHGEVPLLSPYSWVGGALAGEFQEGVFSVFLTAIALAVFTVGLPLPYAAATISVIHLAVLSAGTFRLARVRGLAPNAALLAALVASLNGWTFVWGARLWFPALASLAWLPWVWWALERALRPGAGRWAFLPAGLFFYLAVTAGWPFTVLMLSLLSAWLIARTLWRSRRWTAPWPVAAAGLVGLGLSAPAWLMLLEYSTATIRGARPWNATNPAWMVPPDGWLGLIFPSYFTVWSVWGTRKFHACVEMTGGLVPLAVLGATLLRRGRAFLSEHAWDWGFLLVPVVLAVLPGLGNFQYPFRWLPLFFLVLGLLAGHALQSLRSEAPNFGAWAFVLVLIAWGVALLVHSDPTGVAPIHGACLLGVCLGWAVLGSRGLPAARLRLWAPIAVVLLSCSFMYVVCTRFAEAPTWRIEDRLYDRPALDASVRYVSFYAQPDLLGEQGVDAPLPDVFPGMELVPGNTSMYAGVQFVNGYSPMGPRGLADVCGVQLHGYFIGASAERLLNQEAGPDGLLQLMGVDGLIVADRFLTHQSTLEAEGWRPVGDVAGGRIFHRDGPPSPRVRALDEATCESDIGAAVKLLTAETAKGLSRNNLNAVGVMLLQNTPLAVAVGSSYFLTAPKSAPRVIMDTAPGTAQGVQRFAAAQTVMVEDGRNEAAADVANPSADQEALVVFSRPWYPGYRAECDGKPLPVLLLDLTMPAVRLPPGMSGRLVLRYRPHSLEIGVGVAAATGGVLLVILMIGRIRYSLRTPGQNAAH